MSLCSKVQLTRSDLIQSGISPKWFIDEIPVDQRNTVQKEIFNVTNLTYVNVQGSTS